MMDKDTSIKQESEYNCQHLRERITEAVKALRDETHEVKRPKVKQYVMIPVTSAKPEGKFLRNKSQYKF
jgi:hypothetical protein